jgi:hypothetical protein
MNMLDFDAFVSKYYPNANEQRTNDVKRFLTHVTNLLGDSLLVDKLADRNFLCDAFYMQRLNSITRTHYQKIKEYLVNLFDWCGVQGEVPSRENVIEFTHVYAYFRSLESAMQFIDHVGELILADYNPTQDLVVVKAIFILGWYGLSLKEIVALRRACVTECRNGYGIVSIGDEQISIDAESAKVLMYLKYLDCYKSLPNGKIRYFKSCDEYMFRPTAVGCEGMLETYIVQILNRFNTHVPRHLHQNIAFRNIYRNAKFVDISNDNSNTPLLEKIQIYTKCSPKQAFSYRTQYLAWLELIKQNKI